MTKSIYNLHFVCDTPNGASFSIAKYDHDLNVESTYIVTAFSCDCPQGERGKTCRHQRMLPLFLALARQDTEYFLDFDTKTWHRPLATSYEIEYHDLLIQRQNKAKLHEIAMTVANAPGPNLQGVKIVCEPKDKPDIHIKRPQPDYILERHAIMAAEAKAGTSTLPTLGASPAAPTEPEVPCVSVGAVPIKRRRI